MPELPEVDKASVPRAGGARSGRDDDERTDDDEYRASVGFIGILKRRRRVVFGRVKVEEESQN